jgi:hypothetical protein
LRRELHNQGRPIRRRRGEYLRVRTHRFEISIPVRPTDEQPVWVTELKPLRQEPRRTGSTKRR